MIKNVYACGIRLMFIWLKNVYTCRIRFRINTKDFSVRIFVFLPCCVFIIFLHEWMVIKVNMLFSTDIPFFNCLKKVSSPNSWSIWLYFCWFRVDSRQVLEGIVYLFSIDSLSFLLKRIIYIWCRFPFFV